MIRGWQKSQTGDQQEKPGGLDASLGRNAPGVVVLCVEDVWYQIRMYGKKEVGRGKVGGSWAHRGTALGFNLAAGQTGQKPADSTGNWGDPLL